MRNVIGTAIAYLISGVGYFVAEFIIFDTTILFPVSMAQSFVQGAGSAVFFIVIGIALDKAHIKTRL